MANIKHKWYSDLSKCRIFEKKRDRARGEAVKKLKSQDKRHVRTCIGKWIYRLRRKDTRVNRSERKYCERIHMREMSSPVVTTAEKRMASFWWPMP